MLLTDAVIRIVLRSGHKQSSVPVCQGRWLEPPETDLHASMVSILADKKKGKKKSYFLQFCPKVALGKIFILNVLGLQEKDDIHFYRQSNETRVTQKSLTRRLCLAKIQRFG